jgi:hypothetical protein
MGKMHGVTHIKTDVPVHLEINIATAKPRNYKAPGSDSILVELL